jgi:pimeloyl-ACP methyl ester carboxylesterase
VYSGHAADDESGYVDIVVVHGIFTNDFNEAWKTTNSLNETVSWLTDTNMLHTVVPHLRVLNFRYDPQPGRDGIRAHLERTSSILKNKIQENILHIKHRPIIFVAHGYGGLVVLKALVAENLGSRTIGLLSFATPFRTDDSSPALPSFPWSSRSTDAPEVLRELLQEYRRSPSSKHIQIRCFYETQPNKAPVSTQILHHLPDLSDRP